MVTMKGCETAASTARSDTTCSTCCRRTTSALAMALSAKCVPEARCRASRTRPTVPVPRVLHSLTSELNLRTFGTHRSR